jgi:hypothetical protein
VFIPFCLYFCAPFICRIEGFPFSEAQNNFLSELGAAQQVAMEAQDASDPINSDHLSVGPVSTPLRQNAKAAHYDALHYISTNWSKQIRSEKTKMGYTKNIITWKFTIHGKKHIIILIHSEKSGKRTLTLDDKLILSHTPNIINGLLLQRSSSHKIPLEDTTLDVRIQKLDWSSGKQSMSGNHPPFAYDLVINGVNFSKCTKTLPEYAGGMVDVEMKLKSQQEAAARKKRREMEKKRDNRTELSPE